LNGHYSPISSSPQTSNLSGPSSRRTSFSSASRSASGSGRSGSAGSSRSTSFNLPDDERLVIRAAEGEPGEEVEFGEEMDEETAKKHAEFVRARGRHYSNEAEVMKRAARLIAEEEDANDVPEMPRRNDSNDDDESLEAATVRKVNINGVHH
jgi:protein phosphatase inhibitor 2